MDNTVYSLKTKCSDYFKYDKMYDEKGELGSFPTILF